MKLKLSSLLLVMLAACGACGQDDPAAFTTSHGIKFMDDTDAQQLEDRAAEAEIAIDAYLTVLGKGKKHLDNVKVYVQSDLPELPDGTPVMGFYDFNRGLRIIDAPCWHLSPLLHELSHHMQLIYDHIVDYEHTTPEWWGPTGIVARANALAAEQTGCVP